MFTMNEKNLRRLGAWILTLATLATMTACGKKKPAVTPVETTEAIAAATTAAAIQEATEATETQPETAVAASDYAIVTPYGVLYFPGDWSPFLATEQKQEGDEYVVSFTAVLDSREAPQELYQILFGGDAADAIGALKKSDGKYVAVKVRAVEFTPDATWTDSEKSIIHTMRNTLDYVLSGMGMADADVLTSGTNPTTSSGSNTNTSTGNSTNSSQNGAQETKPPESETEPNSTDMALDTPYMELHYPSQWAENLTIDVTNGDAYGVSYNGKVGSHEQQHLFTVWFGGDQGVSLRTFKTESGELVEIRVEVPEILLDGSWSETEKNTLYAMQEDLNYLLARLG